MSESKKNEDKRKESAKEKKKVPEGAKRSSEETSKFRFPDHDLVLEAKLWIPPKTN